MRPHLWININLFRLRGACKLAGELKLPGSYAEAGVDIELEGRAVRAVAAALSRTLKGREGLPGEALTEIGRFCSLIRMDSERAIAIAMDGVGSKLKVAEALGRFDTIGIDLVAMNVNDLVCSGATPLTLLDYLAFEKVEPWVAGEIAKGLAKGAEMAGISISGGETATLPEIIKGVDLAGAAVGVVKLDEVITGERIEPGDLVVGLASTGIHSNGLTLARKVLLKHHSIDEKLFEGRSVGEELLKPTKIYVREALEMAEKLEVHGFAHITGGGLGNLARISSFGFDITSPPEPQEVFKRIQEEGKVSEEEMYRTFNMGVGFCAVLEEEMAEECIKISRAHGTEAQVIGRVVEEPGVHVKGFTLTY